MATVARVPAGEVPLDARSVATLLDNLSPDMVLVGGQALAFWMDRFRIQAEGQIITSDGDLLGGIEHVHDLAAAMHAIVVLPDQAALTAIAAQIRIPAKDGRVANIDILHLLYTVSGLRKSSQFTEQVIRDSVEVEWRKGRFIRVMDPFDVLDSRVQNGAGLIRSKGEHVLTQARWAIAVARAALLRLASADRADDRLGRQIQRVYSLAHSQAGRQLLKEHAIEVLDAIDIESLRPLSPPHGKQLDNVRVARRRRAAATGR